MRAEIAEGYTHIGTNTAIDFENEVVFTSTVHPGKATEVSYSSGKKSIYGAESGTAPGADSLPSNKTRSPQGVLPNLKYTAEDDVSRHTPAYAEYIVQAGLNSICKYCGQLGASLETAEGARWMTKIREELASVHRYLPFISRERALVITALEETIRGRKWRDLSISQIANISELASKTKDLQLNRREFLHVLDLMNQRGLDVFPSADDDDDEESLQPQLL